MEIFGNDFILGEFRLSDYGMILASFGYNGVSEDNIGTKVQTVEEYIGENPIPVYLGDKYTDKLQLQITIVKNPNIYSGNDMYISEKECRNLLRIITGIHKYQWMKVINKYDEDDIWYKSKVTDVDIKRIGGKVAGIILSMECDSCFGWSDEIIIYSSYKIGNSLEIYNNTDDLYNYVYPCVTIRQKKSGVLKITNISDNLLSTIENIQSGEEIIIDSKNEIISSSFHHDLLLNDFNLNWIRLLPGKNEYILNQNADITFSYRVPRKAVLF